MAAHRSILVVEDDTDLRKSFCDVLEWEGYEVFEAEHGEAALKFLATLSPDRLPGCILLDLMMPVMDGRMFVEVLSRDHSDDWAKINIILATARGNVIDEIPKLPLVVETIRKPMSLEDLLASIERHCEIRVETVGC